MNNRKLITYGLVSVFIILIALQPTIANGEEREVEVGVYDDYWEIMSSFANETHETEFEIRSDTQGGEGHVAIELEYYGESPTGEFAFEMEVVYFDLIEFTDEDSDGKYSSSDTVVKTLPLGDQGVVYFSSPQKETITVDGVDGYKITVTGNIDDTTFSIISYVFITDATIDNFDLSPTALKIELQISNFNFTNDDSLLALRTEVETEMEEEIETGDSENSVEIESNGLYGYYFISDTATIDGSSSSVGVSTVEESGDTYMYSAYSQGDLIIHDPVLGVSDSKPGLPDSNGTNGIGLTNLFWLSLLPIAFLILKRKNKLSSK